MKALLKTIGFVAVIAGALLIEFMWIQNKLGISVKELSDSDKED